MKKIMSMFLVLCIVLSIFAQGSSEEKGAVKLEFAIKETGSTLEAYQKIVDAFNAENNGIEVEIVSYGKDYGSLMKAKMAANDLPDLFTTHGWSVFLYGKYLAPLNERTWVKDLSPEIEGTVTDLSGNIVSLPMDIDITGMVVNMDVLKASGVDKEPTSLPEFLDACKRVKDAGLTPIYVGGKDSSDTAGLFSRLSLILFTTSKSQNYASSLYDGTFDWTKYDQLAELVGDMIEKGYLNVDYLTADKAGGYRTLAENKVAFAFQSNQTIAEAKKINPDANVKMMKLPGLTETDAPFLISGERDAVGAWKDGDNLESALVFIDYLARPENIKLVSEAYGLPPSMTNVTDVNPDIAELLDVINGCYVSNHFDREYLPDGMWNVLKAYSSSILSKEMGIREGSKYMEEEYLRLKK
ncbi:MAG: ABC transporter substrate-binding protein [Candidatus Ornithospirochaeta sp.]